MTTTTMTVVKMLKHLHHRELERTKMLQNENVVVDVVDEEAVDAVGAMRKSRRLPPLQASDSQRGSVDFDDDFSEIMLKRTRKILSACLPEVQRHSDSFRMSQQVGGTPT